MELERIIVGSILSLISIIIAIYVSFTLRKKGPILSNSYMFSSKSEKEKIDKTKEYKLVSIVFGCISLAFGLFALNTFTLWKWSYICGWGVIILVMIYAILDAIKTIRKL